jgi:hypothetical protein
VWDRTYVRLCVLYSVVYNRATQLLYVDESSKKLKNCRRTRVRRVKGDKVGIPVVHTNAGNAGCVIASLSLEGVQSVSVVDIMKKAM